MSVDKLVDSTQLDADLTSVANAIRTKGGTSASLAFPAGFVQAVQAIPTGGTLITKTITENGTYSAEDDDADGYSEVTVNVPSGGGGISADDIAECNISGNITLSSATNIKYSAFYGNKITGVASDTVNHLYGNCFRSCSLLSDVSLPNLTTLHDDRIFQDCTSLAKVYFPKLSSSIVNYTFTGCTSLLSVVLPLAGAINTQAFNGCTALTSFDNGNSSNNIAASAFNNCSHLSIVCIRGSAVKTLSNINAFSGTPFASGGTGGTLYVPNDLIASYQSASNWSTILGYANNQIKSIESTHTDPTAPIDLTLYYADGTPIT